MTAWLDFGAVPKGRKSWFGLGLARNVSSISVNGIVWLQICPDGHWQLRQFNDAVLAEGDARLADGTREGGLEIDPRANTARVLIDGRPVSIETSLPKPIPPSLVGGHLLIHFQWLDSRVSLDAVEVKVVNDQRSS